MKRIKIAVAIAFSVMLTGVFCSCGSNATSSSVSGKNNQTNSSTSKAIENSSASNNSASNSSALKEAKESSENNSSALKGASVGDIVKFGAYEQDNNTSNGKEEIEWVVLAKDGDKALVISKYALDGQPYNTTWTDVTWGTCSLRKWLNGTFLSNAFSSDEQNMFQTTTVTADQNPSFSTPPGNNTTDKVFLLSIQEANRYFSSNEARMCAPTEYAKAQGVLTNSHYSVDGKATCYWWLRSPGYTSNYAATVHIGGDVLGDGNYVIHDDLGVRPALWIDLESIPQYQEDQEAIENTEAKEATENSSILKSASVVDIVKFGAYEQDNNSSNGKEEIEWVVLAKDGDKALVISKYALDCQPYNTSDTDVTWETCSLRQWLNGTFLNNAFSSDEQNMIQTTTVTADQNPSYSTPPGNNTTDKVFLLSIPEADEYFSSNEARKCAPTAYATAQGVSTTSYYSLDGKPMGCWWWLRSPGVGSYYAANVRNDGGVDNYGDGVIRDGLGVRPALLINLGS